MLERLLLQEEVLRLFHRRRVKVIDKWCPWLQLLWLVLRMLHRHHYLVVLGWSKNLQEMRTSMDNVMMLEAKQKEEEEEEEEQ
jgi:4-hydroxy-3-methylbut-2-enyl diphosphate reductase IspH